MLTVEFHCHTIYSKDSLVTPEALLAAARRKGLDRVVITDHNTIAGALAAQKLDPARVIVGEEIMTTQGELLAAFVREEVPPGLTPLETIKRLREQGAFISVSHPFDRFRKGHWALENLLEIAPQVDAIETFNARCLFAHHNKRAAAFSHEHGIPGTVGSDAHTALELGRAVLVLDEFLGSFDLREVLPRAGARARLSSPLIHASSRFAKIVKSLGWHAP
jgi:hypothetical protein